MASVALALWNLFVWLRDGLWPHYPAAAMLADLGIPTPAPSSTGVLGAIDWLLAWSAAGLLAGLGILLIVIGALLNDTYGPEAKAAAAARDKFRPATESERSASWARAGRAEQVDRPRQDDAQARADAEADAAADAAADAEEGEETPLGPPAPSFARSVADGFLGLGCIVLLLVIGLGLFIGWDYFDRTRYNRVAARVASVETTCLLEWPPPRDPAWWESASARRSEEMPCARARPLARGDNPRLIEVRTVTYSYTSPRDGRTYPGTLHEDARDLPPDVRAGGEMIVYSLKADPSRSRGIYPWPVD